MGNDHAEVDRKIGAMEYAFRMVHRAGTKNANAYYLSRNSLPSTNGARVIDWTKGEIIAPATYFPRMEGVTHPLHATEEEKEKHPKVISIKIRKGHDCSAKYGIMSVRHS